MLLVPCCEEAAVLWAVVDRVMDSDDMVVYDMLQDFDGREWMAEILRQMSL